MYKSWNADFVDLIDQVYRWHSDTLLYFALCDTHNGIVLHEFAGRTLLSNVR